MFLKATEKKTISLEDDLESLQREKYQGRHFKRALTLCGIEA